MEESRDPAIKLFGKKISYLSADEDSPATISGDELASQSLSSERDLVLVYSDHDEKDWNPKTPSIREEKKNRKSKILECPRCNSTDTKFCYFNNYNLNQPRHFCKSCHRYWTAGGTTRPVPVGSGRRKPKTSARHNLPDLDFEPNPTQDLLSSAPPPFYHPSNWWLTFPAPQPAAAREVGGGGGGGGGVLVPKTLRIDDPSQVAKSSIWATLGIKFVGFESNNNNKSSKCDYEGEKNKCNYGNYTNYGHNQVLMANPAALSRSINFHETS